MLGAPNFQALIDEFHAELKQHGDSWGARAHELAARRLKAPLEFLDWAKRDGHWSFTLAEVMRDARARPVELAVRLLVAIVHELEDEREVLEQELSPDGLIGAAYAE